MLRSELTGAQTLLRDLDDAGWQLPAGQLGWTVRDLVLATISAHEEIARNGRLPLVRALTRRRDRRLASGRATSPAERLIDELGYWGRKAVMAAPRYRRRRASSFRSGLPPGLSASHLFRVVLPRDAWLFRTSIAEATGQPPALGPHGPEIVRQAVRDVTAAWSGPAVLLEITGPAGGCWVAGDGSPVVVIRTDPVSYLRLLAGDPPGAAEVGGDTAAAAAFLAIRL
jgi:hypothetical protein